LGPNSSPAVSNLVHFSFKIRHLMATFFYDFLEKQLAEFGMVDSKS